MPSRRAAARSSRPLLLPVVPGAPAGTAATAVKGQDAESIRGGARSFPDHPRAKHKDDRRPFETPREPEREEQAVLDLMIGGDAVRRKMDVALDPDAQRSRRVARRKRRGILTRAFTAVPPLGITSFAGRRDERLSGK